MHVFRISVFLLFILTIISCKPEKKVEIEECTDDCTLLSELQTKTDYYSPVKLYNDISSPDLQRVLLNGAEVGLNYGRSFLIEESGFYELKLEYSSNLVDELILFTLKTPERENAEWGIGVWVPAMFTTEEITDEEIKTIYPRQYFEGIAVPFVFYVYEGNERSAIYSEAQHTVSESGFYIKRGVGSVNLISSDVDASPLFLIGGELVETSPNKVSDIDLELSGELTEDLIISENSVVTITSDLHIPSNVSLTINAGALLLVNEAVDISNEGPIEFNGIETNPIHVTCRSAGKFWGGFISNGTAGSISATYTLFSQSGYHDGGSYNWGHAQRQALFYTDESSLNLDHCYMLDHIGQIFYPINATLELESILVQRVKTSGQLNYSTANIANSIFTDFPDDSQVYLDNDNDGLYINTSDVRIDNCVFMFAKDDGLDSGANGGGTVIVTDSRFEACFHEGSALSSQNDVEKIHAFTNCIFYNCGQGIELGFSSSNHQVTVDACDFLNNGIGIRYGDNYTWSSVNGSMLVKNSQSLYNFRDVWNMVHSLWSPKLENLQFENVQVSSFVEQYPDLEIVNE